MRRGPLVVVGEWPAPLSLVRCRTPAPTRLFPVIFSPIFACHCVFHVHAFFAVAAPFTRWP